MLEHLLAFKRYFSFKDTYEVEILGQRVKATFSLLLHLLRLLSRKAATAMCIHGGVPAALPTPGIVLAGGGGV